MTNGDLLHWAPGYELPSLTADEVDRTMLVHFAFASGDFHPIHYDIDVARRAGFPDVFAHGMLGMAWMGRAVTAWAPQARLRKLETRFTGVTQLGHRITVSGCIVEIFEHAGERCARIEIRNTDQYGKVKLTGEALVALD